MRTAGESAAQNQVSGSISANIPYRETYFILDPSTGEPMDLDDFAIEIQFRSCDADTSTVLLLSTDDATIVVEDVEDENEITRSSFRPANVDVSALSGDYICDFVYEDASGVNHHLAHGVVTFRNEPAQAV